jgi:hypothetical protein
MERHYVNADSELPEAEFKKAIYLKIVIKVIEIFRKKFSQRGK